MNQFTIKKSSQVLAYLATIRQAVHVVYVSDSRPLLIVVKDRAQLSQSAETVKGRV